MSARRRLVAAALACAALFGATAAPAEARVRTYYIAADAVLWNYVPMGRDAANDSPAPPFVFPGQLGWRYHKIVYRRYTDATFKTRSPWRADERYLGRLGPPIQAEVGDALVVVFANHASVPLSIDPSGGVLPAAPGPPIAPGAVHTYRWTVPESAGPGPMDPSSRLYSYVAGGPNASANIAAGLVGPLAVTRRGDARADGTPSDVDRVFFAAFMATGEDKSMLFQQNLADPVTNPRHVTLALTHTSPFSNEVASINGFSFGNMPVPTMRVGERVRWYVFATNTGSDFHIPTWSGQTVTVAGHRADAVGLNPTWKAVADMVPDDPGVWRLYCTLDVHIQEMTALYTVTR